MSDSTVLSSDTVAIATVDAIEVLMRAHGLERQTLRTLPKNEKAMLAMIVTGENGPFGIFGDPFAKRKERKAQIYGGKLLNSVFRTIVSKYATDKAKAHSALLSILSNEEIRHAGLTGNLRAILISELDQVASAKRNQIAKAADEIEDDAKRADYVVAAENALDNGKASAESWIANSLPLIHLCADVIATISAGQIKTGNGGQQPFAQYVFEILTGRSTSAVDKAEIGAKNFQM